MRARRMFAEQLVNMLAAGRVAHIAYERAGVQQFINDLEMVRLRLVYRGPDCRPKNCRTVRVPGFEGQFALKERPNSFKLSSVRGPMQCIHARARSCRRVNALCQQILSNVVQAEKTGAGQCLGNRIRVVLESPPRDAIE